MKKIIIFLSFLLTTLCGQAQETGSVQVATSAPNNRAVTVYYRVPKGYDAKRMDSSRVLFIFGGRNTTGKADATGRLGWGKWADDQGVFLVCPGFKDDNYWEPKAWSGMPSCSRVLLTFVVYHYAKLLRSPCKQSPACGLAEGSNTFCEHEQ